MNDCIEKLSEAIKSYYSGNQIIDDEQYEELVAESGLSNSEIEELKVKSIEVIDKVHHKWPMTSLRKVHDVDDVKEDKTVIWQLKYDGCSLEVHYDENGKFDYACTRGTYIDGDNRTDLAKVMILHGTIKEHGPALSSVRGELVIDDDDWKSISSVFANQRNAASGIANRKTFEYAQYLTFVPYDIIDDATGASAIATIDKYGVEVAPKFSSYDEAKAAFDESHIPCDGLVIKKYEDEDMSHQEDAFAYKFSDIEYETKLIDVDWQIGKTGKLTPIARFATVFIDAEVNRASLGSYAKFEELDLHYGDTIKVKKSNMVIPQVSCNCGGGGNKIYAPKKWNGKDTWIDGANLYGFQDNKWKSVLNAQVSMLCGKGIGGSFIDKCIEKYGVRYFVDLANAVFDDGFHVYGYRTKMVDKARAAIGEATNASLTAFIAALQIDGISWSKANMIANKAYVESNMNGDEAASEKLMSISDPYAFAYAISGFGDHSARSFADSYDEIKKQMNDYDSVFGHYPKELFEKHDNDGMTVAITGRFDGLSRSDVKKELELNNYVVSNSVDKNVKCLVAGNGGGSKRSKAESAGIRIIETGGDLNTALVLLKEYENEM